MRADWLSALALVVFATGCTHSEPAETSAAVPANTPGVARPSEPAPTPREVQDDPVYQRWLDRLGVGSCGAAERLVPSDARYAALHNPGCSRGLNPPVSSRDLAM